MIRGVSETEYLVAARVAWHGELAIVNRNWNSCSEIRIYTPPPSPPPPSVKKPARLPGCPAGRLPGWTGTVISPISAFSLLFPSRRSADRGFYGISSGSSGQTFIPQFAKVEKVNVSFRLLFGSLYSQMLEQITPRDVL